MTENTPDPKDLFPISAGREMADAVGRESSAGGTPGAAGNFDGSALTIIGRTRNLVNLSTSDSHYNDMRTAFNKAVHYALETTVPVPAAHLQAVIDVTKAENHVVRSLGAVALGQFSGKLMGSDLVTVAKRLAQMEDDYNCRDSAYVGLQHLGSQHPEAAATLTGAISSSTNALARLKRGLEEGSVRQIRELAPKLPDIRP